MAASRTLSELVVVREWLHETAPPPPHPDASTGYWRFTKNRVMQGRWTGNAGRAAENVVREMDPDAVVREAEAGRSLAGDDAVRGVVIAIAGMKKEIEILLFRAMTRHWRIRCLRMYAPGISRMQSNFVGMYTNRGARRASAARFSSRGLPFVSFLVAVSVSPNPCLFVALSATAQLGDEIVEEDEEADPDLWYGNKRRALWKSTCTRAALDPRQSSAERALYAALAPSIQTSGVLKSACRTWEDALWATISVLCEERQSEALARLGGGFWEPSGREVDVDVGGEGEGDAVDEEEEAWRADVEQELQALATVQVQEGLGADDPFHISQLHIILDRTDALLDDFASRLRDGAYDPESSE